MRELIGPTSRGRVVGGLFTWSETVKLKTAGFFRELSHGEVEKYHVRLPAEFVQHMKAHSWALPQEEEIEFDAIEL